jgi:lysozyme
LRFSDRGQALLKDIEGFEPDVYNDVANIKTVGYGTVVHADTPLHVTEAEATELMLQAVAPTEAALDTLVLVPLNNNQYDALVIFVYNIGIHAFAQSTMLKKINKNDPTATDEFGKWCYAAGKIVSGLYKRRMREKALYMEKI